MKNVSRHASGCIPPGLRDDPTDAEPMAPACTDWLGDAATASSKSIVRYNVGRLPIEGREGVARPTLLG